MDLKEVLQDLRNKEKEYKGEYTKYGSLCEKYDALYTAYGLFADCIESPNQTKLSSVNTVMKELKGVLDEGILNELRVLYKSLSNELDIAMGEIARKLT